MFDSLEKMRDTDGRKVYRIDETFRKAMTEIFSGGMIKTKMEQFYAALYLMQSSSLLEAGTMHKVPGAALRDFLLASGVFPNNDTANLTLPGRIDSMAFRSSSLTPFYEVSFTAPPVEFPLNGGQGLRVFKHGKCQHARSLIFDSPLRFAMRRRDDGNLEVYRFENVDIVGDFGARGLLDVDINYLSLRSAIFLNGTPLGIIRGKIADREFRQNRHNWLLKLVRRFYSDSSKQVIDW